ncbi:MAG: hypothetical protein HKN76_19680 [Saprospiraceae bacterium]|nr:hypothetical protein [Saprospiraceae bacterium]
MIREIESLQAFLRNGYSLRNCTVQQIDFTGVHINWKTLDVAGSTFLGCNFKPEHKLYLIEKGALVIDRPEGVPYNPLRAGLYTWAELLDGDPESLDLKIYQHFRRHKNNTEINEALWQRIHDHAIDDALREYISMNDNGVPAYKCVGIMGGHSTLRTDPYYHQVTRLSKVLTEQGYMVISGGGPGIMEAANLGAYFAHKSDAALKDVLSHLAGAPHYSHPDFTRIALEVHDMANSSTRSLAIPTWFYGHEPSNVFSPAIAKYFSNSIREDTLLAICLHGVIFAPGSAGTTQEIFMDAAQNHYGTYGYYSPMMFLGRTYFEYETMLFPLLKRLARGRRYEKLLFLSDHEEDIIEFVKQHPPIKRIQ